MSADTRKENTGRDKDGVGTGPIQTRVYATGDGRAVIEQSPASVVLSAEQILMVIDELRACYDYCAAWKQPAQGSDRDVQTGIQT